MYSGKVNDRGRAYKNRKSRTTVPTTCPINFDFSSIRIECKTCEYFDRCLRIFIRAEKLAKGL